MTTEQTCYHYYYERINPDNKDDGVYCRDCREILVFKPYFSANLLIGNMSSRVNIKQSSASVTDTICDALGVSSISVLAINLSEVDGYRKIMTVGFKIGNGPLMVASLEDYNFYSEREGSGTFYPEPSVVENETVA